MGQKVLAKAMVLFYPVQEDEGFQERNVPPRHDSLFHPEPYDPHCDVDPEGEDPSNFGAGEDEGGLPVRSRSGDSRAVFGYDIR